MLKSNKKFTMKFILLYIVFSITAIGVAAIGINQFISRKLNNEMNQLINMNIELTSLKTYFGKNNSHISNYFSREDNQEYYIQYYNNRQIIADTYSNLYESIKYDEKSRLYYRILENLLILEKELADDLFKTENVDIQTYGKHQEIRKLYTYLEQISNYLTEACIEFQTGRYENINNAYKKIENTIYAILLLIAFLNFIYIGSLIKDIVSNLKEFSKSASNLAKGNWYIPDIVEQESLELDLFAVAFNNMKNNIQQYITEIEASSQLEIELYEEKLKNIEMDQLLKESKLLSLQSQMNPHFLFNTINIISRTAMFDGNDTIVKLMQSMSKILRYNLVNISNMVTLKEELDIVQAYLHIQGTRFQDQMSFDFEIDNIDLDDIYIPPMILQPIVENSIKHGFKNKEEDGRITIKVTRKGQDIQIFIEDNGEGIPTEKLETIFFEKDSDCYEECNVGLRNVKKRLELNFNKLNLLKIESIFEHGTTVIITIPTGGEVND